MEKIRKEWLIHLLAWMVVIGMPLFLTRPDRQMVTVEQYLHFLIMVLSFVVVFYLNYYVLIDNYLITHRTVTFLSINLAVIVVLMELVRFASKNLLPPPPITLNNHALMTLRFFLGNTFIYALVLGISVALKMTKVWYLSENSRKEAELVSLKSQMNPHFLFNTLNNIYSLIQIDSSRALKALHDLSLTLRYVLYESSKEKVPLRSELDFITEYIAIMKLRIPKSVKLNVNLPENQLTDMEIAPMLFISPIENAFKHGIDNDKNSFIDISIKISDRTVFCHTYNSNHPKTNSDRSGSGIGLENMKKRLNLIYGNRYTLSYGVSDNVFDFALTITL